MKKKVKILINIELNKDIYDDLVRFSIAYYQDIKLDKSIEYLLTYFLIQNSRH